MSELIAEARVLVTPDTTKFRSLLTAELAAATKGVTVPVQIIPVAAGAASASRALTVERAAQANVERELAGASDASAAAASRVTQAARLEALAAKQLAVAQEEVLGTTTALGTAQTRAARAAAALATARRAEAALTRADTAETAQNTVVTLANAEAKNTEATAALRAAKSHVAYTASLGNAAKGASSAGLSFLGLRGATLAAGGAFLAGAASIVAFGKALGSAAQFETSLNVFQATAGATADQMERIGQVAQDLGADLTLPGVTANSAADALSGLARAGLSVEDSIDGVRGVLQLATAAAISNEDAVNIVASGLNAFSLAGEDAARVADLLAASSKESQGSITDVGLALQQSAAAAAQAGVSVEDTVALLTELGRAGLRGSDAGTSLRVALLRLIAPTKQAKEALDGLGVAIRDEAGNVRPEAFAEITQTLSGFTKAQQDATLALIFGQDAFRAASIIGRDGAVGLREMRDATQEVGVAQKLAAARTKGLSGATENLSNQFQTLGLQIGGAFAGPLTSALNAISKDVSGVSSVVGFLRSIGDETPRAEQSVSELADAFQRLNEQGTRQDAVERVKDLGKDTAAAVLEYQDLLAEIEKTQGELDKLNASGGGGTTGALEKRLEGLNEKLADTQSEGLKATDVMEGFRGQLELTAGAAEGLKNRVDEAFDRMAHPPKTPELGATGPVAIGPSAKLDVATQIAQSNDDLQEVLRLQQIRLSNARKALAASKGNVQQRTALFKAIGDAEASVNATRRQIASQAEAAAKAAAAEQKAAAEKAKTARDQAFLLTQEDTRTAQQRLVSRAGATPGLRDDIQRQQQLHDLLQRQITALKAAKADDKAKQAALRELRKARDGTTDEIVRLRAADEKERQANKQEALAAQEAIAAAEGNIPGQIRFINLQIAAIQKLVDAKKNEQKSLFVLKGVHEGLVKAGNIDLLKRPAVKNPLTGGTSTVFSTSVGIEGGKELLLSRVIGKGKNARVVSVEEALANFKKTGEFLGIFNTVEAANKYAAALHKEQANLVKASKLVGAERAKALESIATFVSQREALQNQQIQEKIALAESIQELTGNKNPLLKALGAAVAETRQDIAAAKKAGKSTVALRTELNNFLLQRKKLLEDADNADTTGGTTLVDLFNKAQDILGGASNVGQTAQSLRDLSANMQIKAQVQQRLDIVNDPAKAAAARQVASTDRLIVAIDLLTQTLTGNTASGTPITRGERNSFKNLSQEQRFFYQKQARLMVEQGLVG